MKVLGRSSGDVVRVVEVADALAGNEEKLSEVDEERRVEAFGMLNNSQHKLQRDGEEHDNQEDVGAERGACQNIAERKR